MTYTTFYIDNPQWFNQFGTSSVINQWSEPKHTPKFKIGDTIVYYTYLLWSKKLAIHKIIDIRDDLYIFISPYNGDEYTMVPKETDERFMEYNECLNKYPEEFIRATRNGPEIY